MQTRPGIVKELRLISGDQRAAWIECALPGRPQPGQYLLGWAPDDTGAALATLLFPGELTNDGFLAAGIPATWEPGIPLALRGPLGNGFTLPAAAWRLALGAIDGSLDRLMPLIQLGLERDMAVTLYIDHRSIFLGDRISSLPSAVEIYPLTSLPEALSWLPLVESGFKDRDQSRARAVGLWQFIASTGYRYGLDRSDWIDERMDPEKSTQAAIAYLTDLHELLGDWMTALAAYNCGEGNVLRQIQKQREGYFDQLWDLYARLPQETRRYVPRFLATLAILEDPAKYGFVHRRATHKADSNERGTNQYVHGENSRLEWSVSGE